MVKNQFITVFALALTLALSACVTQNFEDGATPVVQNQANRDDMAATRISLGLGYLKMGNMPQAKQNLEKAKKFSPDMVQVYTAFAHYYETVGEHKLTIESYEKALSLASDDADTLNNYGVYLCRQDKIYAAEKQFLKAIAVPSYLLVSKSYENLSSCFLQKDNFDKAEIYLDKAIMHSPSSASVLFQMVRLQYAMGKYQQAKIFEQRFEKVTRRFTPQSLALAFKVYSKLGQKRTAKNYGTMLVKMYPQSWQAQQYLLNELELIDADNLAKRYQSTQITEPSTKPKKRIVKLSPKKGAFSKPVVINSAMSDRQVAKNNITKPTTRLKPKSSTSTIASTQTINDALSMTTEIQNNSSQENPVVEPIAEATDKLEVTTDTIGLASAPDKVSKTEEQPVNAAAVIVVAKNTESELTEQAQISATINNNAENIKEQLLKEESLVVSGEKVVERTNIDNEASVQAEVSAEAVMDTIPQEDREIYHVAKKPEPIIEDPTVEHTPDEKSEKVALSKAIELENEKTVEKVTIKEPAVHVVGKGDTLFSISVKYNVKIKALRHWNKLSAKKKLRIKDKLFVENPTVVAQ